MLAPSMRVAQAQHGSAPDIAGPGPRQSGLADRLGGDAAGLAGRAARRQPPARAPQRRSRTRSTARSPIRKGARAISAARSAPRRSASGWRRWWWRWRRVGDAGYEMSDISSPYPTFHIIHSTRPLASSIRCMCCRAAASFMRTPSRAPASGLTRPQTSMPLMRKNTSVSMPSGSVTSSTASM